MQFNMVLLTERNLFSVDGCHLVSKEIFADFDIFTNALDLFDMVHLYIVHGSANHTRFIQVGTGKFVGPRFFKRLA